MISVALSVHSIMALPTEHANTTPNLDKRASFFLDCGMFTDLCRDMYETRCQTDGSVKTKSALCEPGGVYHCGCTANCGGHPSTCRTAAEEDIKE
jgi:hypothetical protein